MHCKKNTDYNPDSLEQDISIVPSPMFPLNDVVWPLRPELSRQLLVLQPAPQVLWTNTKVLVFPVRRLLSTGTEPELVNVALTMHPMIRLTLTMFSCCKMYYDYREHSIRNIVTRYLIFLISGTVCTTPTSKISGNIELATA